MPPVRLAARPGRGYLFGSHPTLVTEPPIKRTVAFLDGQNLYHGAREAFGYPYPNFNPSALAQAICATHSWQLAQVRFYTGVPAATDNPFWHQFWSAKLLAMSRSGVHVYSRTLRYRNKTVTLPSGTTHSFLVAEEKGIDVRTRPARRPLWLSVRPGPSHPALRPAGRLPRRRCTREQRGRSASGFVCGSRFPYRDIRRTPKRSLPLAQ